MAMPDKNMDAIGVIEYLSMYDQIEAMKYWNQSHTQYNLYEDSSNTTGVLGFRGNAEISGLTPMQGTFYYLRMLHLMYNNPDLAGLFDELRQVEFAFISHLKETDIMKFLEEFIRNQPNMSNAGTLEAFLTAKFRVQGEKMRVGTDCALINVEASFDDEGMNSLQRVILNNKKVLNSEGKYEWIYYNSYDLHKRVKTRDFVSTEYLTNEAAVVTTKSKSATDVNEINNFFIGLSPAFEIAIYRLCAVQNPLRNCRFQIGEKLVNVQPFVAPFKYNEVFLGSSLISADIRVAN